MAWPSLPLPGGTVAARREEAMRHGEKDGSLDGKLEAPAFEQGRQNSVDRAGLPETVEDQGRPARSWNCEWRCCRLVRGRAEDGELFGEPSERLEQRVDLESGQQNIQARDPETRDTLADLAAEPSFVLDDEHISSGTAGLSADEQSGAPNVTIMITVPAHTMASIAFLRPNVTLCFRAGRYRRLWNQPEVVATLRRKV